MKHWIAFFFLISCLVSCHEVEQQSGVNSSNEAAANADKAAIAETDSASGINDSLQYEISLDKSVYSDDDPIMITIIAKNVTSRDLKIWIDAGDYPTDADLKIVDSTGNSIIRHHWAELSSQLYSEHEVEQFKTTILPQEVFKKAYNLLSIVRLKNDLGEGSYKLSYNNAEPILLQIK